MTFRAQRCRSWLLPLPRPSPAHGEAATVPPLWSLSLSLETDTVLQGTHLNTAAIEATPGRFRGQLEGALLLWGETEPPVLGFVAVSCYAFSICPVLSGSSRRAGSASPFLRAAGRPFSPLFVHSTGVFIILSSLEKGEDTFPHGKSPDSGRADLVESCFCHRKL